MNRTSLCSSHAGGNAGMVCLTLRRCFGMRATMVTAFFKFKPCELETEGGVLHVRFLDGEEGIEISGEADASFPVSLDGVGRLVVTAGDSEYHFILDGSDAARLADELASSGNARGTVPDGA